MEISKIEEIIKCIEKNCSKENAFLITSWLTDGEFPMLEGNREGFRLLAAEFLKTSLKKPDVLHSLSEDPSFKEWFFDKGNNFYKILRVYDLDKQYYKTLEPKKNKKNSKDNMFKIFFFVLTVLSLIIIIVGLVTIYKWIF